MCLLDKFRWVLLLMRLKYTTLTTDFDPWALRAKFLISLKLYTPDLVYSLIGFEVVTSSNSIYIYLCTYISLQEERLCITPIDNMFKENVRDTLQSLEVTL